MMLRSVVRRICSSATARNGSSAAESASRGGLGLKLIHQKGILSPPCIPPVLFRPISLYARLLAEATNNDVDTPAVPEEENNNEASTDAAAKPTEKVSEKDRTKVISVETSIRYLQSTAFQETYQGNPVWVLYRRNFKGQFAPKRTRKTCIRKGMLTAGNPCPICRDEYLVLDYKNVELLKQFISPYNGETLSYAKTGLCQKRHAELLVAILKAKDYGLITYDVPFREYDYSEYTKIYESYKLN